MTKNAILVVDDDAAGCEYLADFLKVEGFDVEWTQDSRAALELAKQGSFAAVVTDLRMPGMDGLQLCKALAAEQHQLPVIVATAFGSISAAVEAMRAGAFDFVTKPIDADALVMTLRRAIDYHDLLRERDALRRVVSESSESGELFGASPAMIELLRLIERVAGSQGGVLISGESGTGKELLARELHRKSRRAEGPLVMCNCVGQPEAQLDISLFGQKDGEPGLLAKAAGGTLVLDEVSELPQALQLKLLNVVQDSAFKAQGSSQTQPFDARWIALTNSDLEAAVEEKRFREDLYYAINVIHLEVPALRARGTDVLSLAQRFIDEFSARDQKPMVKLSPSAAKRLLKYDWPGNVRELRNVIQRAVALAQGPEIGIDDLPVKIRDYAPERSVLMADQVTDLLPLEEVEKRYIRQVLSACRGNKSAAAKILKLSRKTLYRKLDQFAVEAQFASRAN